MKNAKSFMRMDNVFEKWAYMYHWFRFTERGVISAVRRNHGYRLKLRIAPLDFIAMQMTVDVWRWKHLQIKDSLRRADKGCNMTWKNIGQNKCIKTRNLKVTGNMAAVLYAHKSIIGQWKNLRIWRWCYTRKTNLAYVHGDGAIVCKSSPVLDI